MNRKILRTLLSVLLVFTAWVSSASRFAVASAASSSHQGASPAQATSGVEGNWQGALDVGGFKLRPPSRSG
jgi:hypothetical protein